MEWLFCFTLWAVGGALLIFITTSLLLAKLHRGKAASSFKLNAEAYYQTIVDYVAKCLPVHHSCGWCLCGVTGGLRVFTRPSPDLPPSHPKLPQQELMAASLILDLSVKRAVALTCNVKELGAWSFVPSFRARLLVGPQTSTHVVQFSVQQPAAVPGLVQQMGGLCHSLVGCFIRKFAPFLGDVLGESHSGYRTEQVERYLHEGGSYSCVFSYPQPPSSLPYLWSCLFLTALRQQGVTLATMVVLPPPGLCDATTAATLTGQLSALRQHVTMKRFKAYCLHQLSAPVQNILPGQREGGGGRERECIDGESGRSVAGRGRDVIKDCSTVRTEAVGMEGRSSSLAPQLDDTISSGSAALAGHTISSGSAALAGHTSRGSAALAGHTTSRGSAALAGHTSSGSAVLAGHTSSRGSAAPAGPTASSRDSVPPQNRCLEVNSISPHSSTSSAPLTAQAEVDARYLAMASDCSNKLVLAAQGGMADGWIDLGTSKEVHVMKSVASGEAPLTSFKGTGSIQTPPEFLLRLLLDPAHASQLDDLLKEARLIHQVSPAVSLMQLIYKAIWPTSPRDFSLLSIAGQVDQDTWISSARSVLDDRIPAEKGCVRAHLESGGYVIQAVPGQPDESKVTYVACVDMKGHIPMFVVNKVGESQPLCVKRLRTLAEPLYQDMKRQPQTMASFEQKFPIPYVIPDHKTLPEDKAEVSVLCDDPLPSPLTLEQHLAHSQSHFDPSPTHTPCGNNEMSASLPLDGSLERCREIVQVEATGFATPPPGSDDEREDMYSSMTEDRGAREGWELEAGSTLLNASCLQSGQAGGAGQEWDLQSGQAGGVGQEWDLQSGQAGGAGQEWDLQSGQAGGVGQEWDLQSGGAGQEKDLQSGQAGGEQCRTTETENLEDEGYSPHIQKSKVSQRGPVNYKHAAVPGEGGPVNYKHAAVPGEGGPANYKHAAVPGEGGPVNYKHAAVPGEGGPVNYKHAAVSGEGGPVNYKHAAVPGEGGPVNYKHAAVPGEGGPVNYKHAAVSGEGGPVNYKHAAVPGEGGPVNYKHAAVPGEGGPVNYKHAAVPGEGGPVNYKHAAVPGEGGPVNYKHAAVPGEGGPVNYKHAAVPGEGGPVNYKHAAVPGEGGPVNYKHAAVPWEGGPVNYKHAAVPGEGGPVNYKHAAVPGEGGPVNYKHAAVPGEGGPVNYKHAAVPGDNLEFSVPQDVRSLTKENIAYPRLDSGEVDYRTLANQTAAHVLEEMFHISTLDVCDPSTFVDQSGGWRFEGVERDVVILSKVEDDSDVPFTSVIGKGLIPLSPGHVFNSLRNPHLRFTYDSILKKLHIVQQLETDLYILHLHHQTTQCFIKQASDFCLLVSERSEPNKQLLLGNSIETPSCPLDPALHRGKVQASGWVVEPRLVNGVLCTEITYILQVDVGSRLPKSLLHLVTRRQPLAVAYLRDYLLSTSLENSTHT